MAKGNAGLGKSAAAKGKTSKAGKTSEAEARATETLSPRAYGAHWFHFVLGQVYFVLATALFLIADTSESAFAAGISIALVVMGAVTSAYGLRRGLSPDPAPSRFDEYWPIRFFTVTWKEMDDEAHLERVARREAGLGWDWRPLVALVTGAVCLTLMEYFGGSGTFMRLVEAMSGTEGEENWWNDLRGGQFSRLYEFVWWAGWRIAGYLIVPVMLIKATGQRIRDQGFETKGFFKHAGIYIFAFHIVFFAVIIVSYTGEFSTYYPFYKLATRSWFDFLAWEVLYAWQFLSLEFFFRGWWLKTLKPMMGSHAIFAMVVPYCMIHYGKPFPETMGAIVAGILLGTLAMKTRSIWSGFLIHVSIAVAMDVAALLQTSGMPTEWYPAPW